MYLPKHFEENRTEVLHQLVRSHPLGTLVTLEQRSLNANHIPFELDPGCGPCGALRAHVARNNPVWQQASPSVESLVIFQGPQAYISPSLYATKKETERVVPTYNFIVAHAYGTLHAIDDPAWLRAHLERLTNDFEAQRDMPWKISDAPEDFIQKLLASLVGIEFRVSRWLGKWKVSQNQPQVNRESVERGLRVVGDMHSVAMADAVAGK